MLDHRAIMMLCLPPAGLGLGLILWLAVGRPGSAAEVDELAKRLNDVRPPVASQAEPGGSAAAARPLFSLTTGPGAVTEPTLRLDGISRSGRRTAALVSIDNAEPQWLTVGQSVDEIRLEEINASSAVFDTLLGVRTVKLGQSSGPRSTYPRADQTGASDTIPPGFRTPPPPASAPAMGG